MLFNAVLVAIPVVSLGTTSTVRAQESTLADSTSVEQREQAFRKKWYVAASEKITFKMVPSADELQDMIAKDPALASKKHPKKTVIFSDFEKLLKKPDFQYSKIMSDAGIFFIEYSQEEKEERAKRVVHPIKVKAGDAFPPFSLANSDGSISDNHMFKDRLTLINFFFDKCAPCIEETPFLNEFAEKHPEIQVLGITFDSKKKAANYKKEYGFTWLVAVEGASFIDEFLGIRAYPSYALIDGQGKVLAIGGQSDLKLDIKNLVKSLEELIEKAKKS